MSQIGITSAILNVIIKEFVVRQMLSRVSGNVHLCLAIKAIDVGSL